MKSKIPRSSTPNFPYPKPGPEGGRLIREIIGFLRERGCVLPVDSDILIAVSGGADSVALAHLVIHFGRRMVARERISLLHINHQWRAEESNQDQEFVQELGKKWKVPVICHKLKEPAEAEYQGSSWEEQARVLRKNLFMEEASKRTGLVLTAHQADDLAETLLWRLFTGANETHGGGIAFQHEMEMRPLLKIRKGRLQDYLKEVGQSWREDSTNRSSRFMRSRMRQTLMPELETLFPCAVDHLVQLALGAQQSARKDLTLPFKNLFQAAGLRVRRSHLTTIAQKRAVSEQWFGEIHLPGGWKLTCEKQKRTKGKPLNSEAKSKTQLTSLNSGHERWILERI